MSGCSHPRADHVRILHVIQELGTGGAEQVVRRLSEASLARGEVVAIACAGDARLPRGADRLRIPMLARRPDRTLAAAWSIRRFASAWRPDVIHAHNPGIALATALAARRGASWPALATLHGVPPEDDAATARLLGWARLPVVACGPGVAAALRAHGLEPLTTICNGITPPPPPADQVELRRQWGVPPQWRLVMAAGRLVAQKRHDLAVAAMASLPDAALVIVGDGPLRPALEQQIAELHLTPRVRLVGARSDVRALLAVADVVVQPSDWEGLPLVVLEAMSAARPVVAARAPGLRELVRDGEDGLLVRPGDAAALATSTARVLADARLGRRLGDTAARRVEREFSEDAMVDSYQLLWRALVARRAA
ncbi:MAG: glycosyltransferase [Candidatus Dormibacteraeota bacterium]|nr:glycosyltransferase [Candidatus Dormibacteraeota bacterium]